MLPRTYDNQVCSVARALEAIGDRWTMLVIRDAFVGVRRFDEFQQRLGIARNVLTDRLSRLVDEGILEKREYRAHGEEVHALGGEPVLEAPRRRTRTARPWRLSTGAAAARSTSASSATAAASR